MRLALAFALLTSPAFAQTGVSLGAINTDPTTPVEITAEALSFEQDTGKAVFQGTVVAMQGALRMSADKVEVSYDDGSGDIQRLVATGNVTFVTQTEAAEAASAVYDLGAQSLRLSGDVLLTQGKNAIGADQMVVDLRSGQAQMTGNVRTVFGGN